VNVTFYKSKNGHPGKIIKQETNVSVEDNSGSFGIELPTPVPLPGGNHYWVSVQANMDFDVGGQWGWETTTTSNGDDAQWQNPGGGWGECPKWTSITVCWHAGPGLMFQLEGDPLLYLFTPIDKPDQDGYTTDSCKEGLAAIPDGTVVTQISDGACKHKATTGHKRKKYSVNFSVPMEKLSVPGSWPSWNIPPAVETATPDVLFTGSNTSVTITYNFPVRTGGLEAEPVPGSGFHEITADFYDGSTLLGSITRNINSDGGALLLGAHCKYLGWPKIVVHSDVPFAIANIRV
jgi:hypothetical protein